MPLNSTELLRKAPIFSELSLEELEHVGRVARRLEFSRDEIVFAMDETADGLYVIASGRVKVCLPSVTGREVILATLGPGQFFGEMSLLDHSPRSASVVAQLPTVCLHLHHQDFDRLLDERPAISRKLLKELSLRLRRANSQMESLGTLDVIGRLARFLIGMAREHGQDLGNGWVAVRRPTHVDIANSIGSTRETVTRLLADLEAHGVVINEGKMSYIRQSTLRDAAQ